MEKEVLRRIERGEIAVKILESRIVPSPFAHNIVAQGYSDIVLMEDKRRFLIKLYEKVLQRVGEAEEI